MWLRNSTCIKSGYNRNSGFPGPRIPGVVSNPGHYAVPDGFGAARLMEVGGCWAHTRSLNGDKPVKKRGTLDGGGELTFNSRDQCSQDGNEAFWYEMC